MAKNSKTKQTRTDRPTDNKAVPESRVVNTDQKSTAKGIVDTKPSTIPAKRKAKPAKPAPSKAPRRSARSAPHKPSNSVELLQILLSPSSLPLCQSEADTESPGARTYSSASFSPFEELVCAVILSRPISHTLGVRSIRTLLNPPYDFVTPKALMEAGVKGRRKALDEARTQHRQKTAQELGGLVDAVGEEDVELKRVREEAEYDVGKERDILQSNIKGLGKTGLDIFFRRIQGLWAEAYPFVDVRTAATLSKLGLPSSAEDLRKLLDEKWKELKVEDINGETNEEKRRQAFARVLERAVGADLEGNLEKVAKAANG